MDLNIPLPKKDFNLRIKTEKDYLEDLQALDKAYVDEINNSKTFYVKKLEYKVKRYDLVNEIMVKRKLIADYENHYNNIFLPNYEKELHEMETNWPTFLAQAKATQNKDVQDVLEYYKNAMDNNEVRLIVYKEIKSINEFTPASPSPQ